jgi:hypothetical protein
MTLIIQKSLLHRGDFFNKIVLPDKGLSYLNLIN